MARRRLGFWRRLTVVLVKPPLMVLTKRTWSGAAHVPASGGVIIVANHVSYADPLVVAHFVYDAGRWPQFLAKHSIFTVPVLGWLLRRLRQIPVFRGSTDAARALEAAVAALRAGQAVVIYPEGTITKDPDLWPMRGKTGVARLWLATKAPVVPVASWGAQTIVHPHTRRVRPRPRTAVTVAAGQAVDLSAFADVDATTGNLTAITQTVMDRLTQTLADVRGAPAPTPRSPAKDEEASS